MSKQMTIPELVSEMRHFFKGTIKTDEPTLEEYSHDTSIFEIKPQMVVYPHHKADLKNLVKFISKNKGSHPDLSLTGRSGGSDMSGGSVNDSIIVDFRHFKKVGKVKAKGTVVEPGVMYRDFEPKSLRKGLVYPTYPASKNLAAWGGMINNNAGGEMTLRYGQTIDYVTQVKVILADGNEYTFGELTMDKLKKKMQLRGFEGELYRKLFKLIDDNYDQIMKAKPQVSKNSTGYLLWDVYDKDKGAFNVAKLIVGSQGTLGLLTEAKINMVPVQKAEGLLTVYLNDIDRIPELINMVLATNPDTFEAFDDATLKLAIQFMPQFMLILGLRETIMMGFQFLPMLGSFLIKGLPKFTFLVEYTADTQEEVAQKIDSLNEQISSMGLETSPAKTPAKADRYKVIRRESFNLLRKNVRGKHSAAFIDDFIIPPEKLPQFFPKFIKIMDKYDLFYTIAGHMGNGNFHIIPLMDLSIESERAKIPTCTKEVNALVLEFGGSISAEHNEGLIRGPFMEQMYGTKMFRIFKEVKKIFDPLNIFNPHKKTDASMDYAMSHIRRHY